MVRLAATASRDQGHAHAWHRFRQPGRCAATLAGRQPADPPRAATAFALHAGTHGISHELAVALCGLQSPCSTVRNGQAQGQ